MASLALSGHFPPDRLLFLEVLARSLPRGARLRAQSEGAYPGADLMLLYDWQGQRVACRLKAEFLLQWEPHLAAYKVERFLWRQSLMTLHSAGHSQDDNPPSAFDHANQEGMHRRPTKRVR
jgi:hypothetical protein